MTPLQELADAFGIELTRPTSDGSFAAVPDETLVALCRALGATLRSAEDAPDALTDLRATRVAGGIEPVAVAWDDAIPELTLYDNAEQVDDPFTVVVELDTAATIEWPSTECRPGEIRAAGGDTVARTVVLPHALPYGAHRVHVHRSGQARTATLLVAPRRAAPEPAQRRWGVFAPLYALHDARSPTGDLGTLRRFADWADGHGASIVGTLPLLATFLGRGAEPCDPSPYAPVSRRFWNEVYLDAARILPAPIEEPAPGELVDLPARAARLRAALEPFAETATTDPDLRRWLEDRPDVTEYAQFRSSVEGGNGAAVRYHEFVQWQCEQQLQDLAGHLDARGQALYMDFPIGTHRNGFDVETDSDRFVRDASVGAPPDAFFAGGQNWGFPPPDPHAARRDGCCTTYLRECLDAHLRFARVLRLDHVMGLHRLWFVPEGAPATEGAYVHYPAEEQWAAVCLVAARHGAEIVGEDLGTVPDAARHALDEHGALGMWVVQFETHEHGAVAPPRREQLACTGTHDLAPFATWWHSLDADRRAALTATLLESGDLDPSDPAPAPVHVLAALYAWMSRSAAPLALASLEDLWLETEPQNHPGTPSIENFRRRAAYGIDAFDEIPELPALLHRLGSGRRSTPR